MIRLVLFSMLWLCVCANAATTYYVRPDGNNANTGTGTGTGSALQTIDHAMDSHATAGDTIIVAPGVYREAVSCGQSGSAGNLITVRGDPRNESGFSGISPGPVRVTAFTTNDKTDTGSNCINVGAYDYWTFEDLWIDGADNYAVTCDNGSTYVTLNRCHIVGGAGYSGINLSVATDTAANWSINNCSIIGYYAINIVPQAAPTAAELDLNIAINNCLLIANTGCVRMVDRGGTYPFAGVDVDSCTMIGYYGFWYTISSTNSGSTKNSIKRCVMYCNAGILTSATKTAVSEDWNLILASSVRSAGESAGGNTQTKYAFILEMAQSSLWFGVPKQFGSIPYYSPIAGFDGSGSGISTDFSGRSRPSGGGLSWSSTNSSIGSFEATDFGKIDATVVSDGTYSIKLTGPGTHQVAIPVNAVSTTLTVDAAYGNLYGGTALPQVVLVASPSLGVSTETEVVTTASTNTFDTLTFSAFTPSAKGVVFLRLTSTDTNGTGQAWFDKITRNY